MRHRHCKLLTYWYSLPRHWVKLYVYAGAAHLKKFKPTGRTI